MQLRRGIAWLGWMVVPTVALADPPPPPKVCIVVAGDPDAHVQSSALTLVDAIRARGDLRGVFDPDLRNVLVGSADPDPSLAWLVRARRGLTGTDADASALDALTGRLGCALAVEVSARAAGVQVRPYDAVAHRFGPVHDSATATVDLVDSVIVPVAQAVIAEIAASPAPSRESSAPSASANVTSSGPPSRATASSGSTAAVPSPAPIDPRVALTPPHETRASSTFFGQSVWGWVIGGTAAAGLIAAFLIAQNSGPGSTVITVHHDGMP